MKSTLDSAEASTHEDVRRSLTALSGGTLPDLDAIARSRLLLLDVLKEGVYQVDEDGFCLFMNRAAGLMLGYEVGEAKGQLIHNRHHCCGGRESEKKESEKQESEKRESEKKPDKKDPEQRTGPTAAAITSTIRCPIHGPEQEVGERSHHRVVFLRRDGQAFPVECTSQALYESGIYRGAIVSFSDVTERQRVEQRLRAQFNASRILSNATSLEHAIPQLTQSLGEDLGLGCAAMWLTEQPGKVKLAGVWHPAADPMAGTTSPAPTTPTDLLARTVLSSGSPAWIADLTQAPAAAHPPFGSRFAIPLFLDRVVGVMEFFFPQTRPHDPDLLNAMSLIGEAVAQFIGRRQAEQSQRRLVAILEAAREFVGVAIDPNGTLLSLNRAVEDIFGYTRTELLGQSLELLIPGYQGLLSQSEWTSRRLDESTEATARSTASRQIRLRGRHKNGRSIPLELSMGESVEEDKSVLTFIAADITERVAAEEMLEQQAEDLRRSEEALRQQTRLVDSILSSMSDGVIAADENFDLILVNPVARKLVPHFNDATSILDTQAAIETAGTAIFQGDGTTHYAWDQLPIVRAIRGETIDDAEVFLSNSTRPEGTWLNASARPLIDEVGQLRGGVVIVRDVTEQKASAEILRRAKDDAESANRAKSTFLSRMSHELRTPMNAVLGFAQLLELDPLTDEQQDSVSRILKAGRHLLGLINEILDISRIEAGRLNLEMEQVDPAELMNAALDLVRPLMDQRGITLIGPQGNAIGRHVQGDRQRLTQVFLNLLSNAVKYNRPSGVITVSFTTVPARDSAPAQLRLGVTDTGEGISPEDVKKLFVPFERLNAERSATEGTGLGLALTDQLVKLMNGRIGVESERGVGSTFYVELPLLDDPALEAPAETGPQPLALTDTPQTEESTLNVLYIEDSLTYLKLVEAMLARIPRLRLLTATLGELGLDLAREHAPSLILLDVQLPDTTGMKVLQQLQQDERTRDIPVVVVSADATEKTKKELLDAGARAYVGKPIDVRNFLEVIAGII